MDTNEANHSSQFRYSRLSSPRSIRLVKLLPSTTFDAQLAVQLVEVELKSKPCLIAADTITIYDALSYTWGSPDRTCLISCNNQCFHVTPNCESALRYLRLERDIRVLWVDAICINQRKSKDGLDERAVQVPLMGEIYAGARQTLCWLGAGTKYTDSVMRLLGQVGDCPSQRGLAKLMRLEETLRNEGLLNDGISCLDHVFTQAWHSRIWTVQEVAFSDDCLVVCGWASVSWPQYSKAAKFLIYDQFLEDLDIRTAKSLVAIDVRDVLREYLSSHSSLPSGPSNALALGSSDSQGDDIRDVQDRKVTFLTSCLTDVNKLQATDPRDRIYGMYAVYSRLGVPLPAPDYTKPIVEVYTDATIALITWSASLIVLRDACSLNRNSTLPSWVPDWSDQDTRLYTPSTNVTATRRIEQCEPSRLFPTTGELHTQGKVVGHVVEQDIDAIFMPFPTRSDDVGSPILLGCQNSVVEDIDFLRLLVEKIRFFRALRKHLQNTSFECCDDEDQDLFLQVVTLGDGIQGQDLVHSWHDLLDIFDYPNGRHGQRIGHTLAETWMAADVVHVGDWNTEALCCTTIAATLLTNSLEPVNGYLPSHDCVLDLIKELSQNMADQAIITIRSQSEVRRTSRSVNAALYIGTTFRCVQARDTVAVLEGADWPVVLRPQHHEWSFVGPAFVLGMIESEDKPIRRRGQVLPKQFVII